MKKIVLFSHGGSGNRGCEAIVRSTQKMLDNINGDRMFYLCSLNKKEDNDVGISGFNDIIQYSNYVKRKSFNHIVAAINNRFTHNNEKYITLAQKDLYKNFNKETIALSIGGDNYCYSNSKWLYLSHSAAKKRNAKTVLWGCSLEENNMNEELIKDLNSYDLIIARESITYSLLKNHGLENKSKLYPDPAFQLDIEETKLPFGFRVRNTVGINLSPYIFKSKISKDEVVELYLCLIKHIIETSDMQIALIPHVFWSHNNDLEVLNEIYSKVKETDRVVLINEEYNCMQLKYIISQCKLFIGARTHSTIAAYSSCVPTLVLGYSVKSRGIARDIFGSEEKMVIQIQELDNHIDLINAYEFIKENELKIRSQLTKLMPIYKGKCDLAGMELMKFN
ncbi:polysaccharide pyruvyl transferase family protein [Peribacillus sp. NPDC097284]|uniref:polysaccharide pyruvyl transferase family protein n=1 Tax=Peribacillus sp. NPDC097284 TaxID=3364401 RepID=UPI003825F439